MFRLLTRLLDSERNRGPPSCVAVRPLGGQHGREQNTEFEKAEFENFVEDLISVTCDVTAVTYTLTAVSCPWGVIRLK